MSLFHLVESAELPGPWPQGSLVPFQAHTYFEAAEGELGQRITARVVWVSSTGHEIASDEHPVEFISSHVRVRSQYLKIPEAPGKYSIFVEWKRDGAQWERAATGWPIELRSGGPTSQVPSPQ